ncbi:MAG: peptidylprolyl isomerase [Saprospiraceae bacterium]|nr:peptidylprolyl isomerase [Saprospiraceae bacterium]
MKQSLLFILLVGLLGACKAPTAMFEYRLEDGSVPTSVQAQNLSTNASSYEWSLNDSLISQAEDVDFQITGSGRYELSLKAIENDKEDILSKSFIVEAPQNCRVQMVTSLGTMVFELYEDTPIHLDNFIDLIERGYYNGIAFHRVMQSFMIQAGDNNTRIEGRKFEFEDQIPAEINEKYIHHKGALAAARMPDEVNPERASSGTQFYIVHGRSLDDDQIENYDVTRQVPYTPDQRELYKANGGAPQLDGAYTIFGFLIDGEEVIDAIAGVETNDRDRPLEDVRIIEMKVLN